MKRLTATIVMVVALLLGATTYAAVLRRGSVKPRSTGAGRVCAANANIL